MEFRNQVRLCLANYDFETHIMLRICLAFRDAGLLVRKKRKMFNSSVLLTVNLFSEFYYFISLIKKENTGIVLFSLMNAYYSNWLIDWFKEEVSPIMQIKAGVMLSICLVFHQESGYAYTVYALPRFHAPSGWAASLSICCSSVLASVSAGTEML